MYTIDRGTDGTGGVVRHQNGRAYPYEFDAAQSNLRAAIKQCEAENPHVKTTIAQRHKQRCIDDAHKELVAAKVARANAPKGVNPYQVRLDECMDARSPGDIVRRDMWERARDKWDEDHAQQIAQQKVEKRLRADPAYKQAKDLLSATLSIATIDDDTESISELSLAQAHLDAGLVDDANMIATDVMRRQLQDAEDRQTASYRTLAEASNEQTEIVERKQKLELTQFDAEQ